MKLINVPAEDFDHLIVQCHNACICIRSRPDDYFNLEVMKPCFCMSTCLKGKVPAGVTVIDYEVAILEWDLKSSKNRLYTRRLSYPYPDDTKWAVSMATGNRSN